MEDALQIRQCICQNVWVTPQCVITVSRSKFMIGLSNSFSYHIMEYNENSKTLAPFSVNLGDYLEKGIFTMSAGDLLSNAHQKLMIVELHRSLTLILTLKQ